MQSPAEKISVIKSSLRCLGCGIASWVPLIGLPFAASALVWYWKAGRISRGEWNPANHYRIWGFVLAIFGGLISVAAILALGIAWANHGTD